MEVFFCGLLNFFHQADQTAEREDEQAEQGGDPVGQYAGQEEDRRTEQQEVEHRPQGEGGGHVEAQHPAGGGGIGEEASGDQQPEAQIQGGAQQGDAQAPPQNPKEVVYQAQSAPQGGRPQEGAGLVGQVDAHGPVYRNSRARKPPRPPPSSS